VAVGDALAWPVHPAVAALQRRAPGLLLRPGPARGMLRAQPTENQPTGNRHGTRAP